MWLKKFAVHCENKWSLFGQSYYRNKGTEEKNAPSMVYLDQTFQPYNYYYGKLVKQHATSV